MDIKCKFNPNYFYNYPDAPRRAEIQFCGAYRLAPEIMQKSVDKFVKRPADVECAAGLLSFKPKTQTILTRIKNYSKNYVKNIKHTYEHKVVFALVERELFGKNTIDSITHDADKMILYLLGFPKSFVSDFHRKHSKHHPESGKKMNLRSMLCDNIASSPEFKPEKKRSLREHFNTCEQLQNVDGLKDILERYHYGEDLNFKKINADKNANYTGNIAAAFVGIGKLFLLSLL